MSTKTKTANKSNMLELAKSDVPALTLPVVPTLDKRAKYEMRRQGETYTVESGKHKGEVRQYRTTEIKVSSALLRKGGIDAIDKVSREMAIALKADSKPMIDAIHNDPAWGMQRIATRIADSGQIALNATYVRMTDKRFYAMLLANGLTPDQAHEVCAKYGKTAPDA